MINTDSRGLEDGLGQLLDQRVLLDILLLQLLDLALQVPDDEAGLS